MLTKIYIPIGICLNVKGIDKTNIIFWSFSLRSRIGYFKINTIHLNIFSLNQNYHNLTKVFMDLKNIYETF